MSSYPTYTHNETTNPVGIIKEMVGGIPHSHILETKVNIIDDEINLTNDKDLVTHANLTMKKELQFMDIVEDEKEQDISFVPRKVINHKISREPHREIHKSKDKNGKDVFKVKIVQEQHLRVKVSWKNGTSSWVAADALKEQNPFIFLPYVKQRKLFTCP